MSANLIFIFRRRWPILVILPLFVVAIVVALAPSAPKQPPMYTATVYVGSTPGGATLVDLEQAAIEVKQPAVASVAATKTGADGVDPRAYARPLKAKVDDGALTLKLSATLPQKQKVVPYVRSFAEAFIAVNQLQSDKAYQQKVDDAQAYLDQADKALNDFLVANALALAQPQVDPALSTQRQVLTERASKAEQAVLDARDERTTTPYRITGSDPVTQLEATKLTLPQSGPIRAFLAFIMAFLGAVALVAILEKVNPRIDSPKHAEELVGAPVVAMVPVMRGKRRKVIERADLAQFSGPFAEAFRAMRAHLDFRSSAEGFDRPPCVMIVSSAPGEGKTTSTAFLALSYAEVGRDVVVIGADFRRPAVHRLFGVARTPGLSSRLLDSSGQTNPEDVVRSIIKRDEKTGVRVIPSGPGTDRVTGLLDDLAAVTSAGLDSGCTVVIDTVPVMVANDAIDFLPLVDWVVVVVRLGKTTERSLRQTITSLELNAARIVGCIMVGSLESSDAKRYYYSYYKLDEVAKEAGEQARRRRTTTETSRSLDIDGPPAARPADLDLPEGEPLTIEEVPTDRS